MIEAKLGLHRDLRLQVILGYDCSYSEATNEPILWQWLKLNLVYTKAYKLKLHKGY